ncbi:DUF309 domain-containing protein [Geobacter sp. DSM 9736]|uniref:DUF309 domain-containing protein n=1 Tax=Geobacter sp. DSM 9736 TaxID=1277350 RepID=UPI000B5E974D|nr:DUF309 domain-containing protein [Geobacter sp. DSM 9736]SNB47861.1 hypothetical protein SAMN06269301_3355 [Geobacter sp. DSM 9736]
MQKMREGSSGLAHRERSCRQSPPDELIRGIEQFNRGAYLECRTTLEFVSIHEPRLERNLYQGIAQIAIALHHWQSGDYRGTMRQLKTALQLLRQVAPVCQLVDVEGLIHQTEQLQVKLEGLGMERMNQLEQELLPRIDMTG